MDEFKCGDILENKLTGGHYLVCDADTVVFDADTKVMVLALINSEEDVKAVHRIFPVAAYNFNKFVKRGRVNAGFRAGIAGTIHGRPETLKQLIQQIKDRWPLCVDWIGKQEIPPATEATETLCPEVHNTQPVDGAVAMDVIKRMLRG